jgi:signal transduction histidine kinase
VRAKPSFTASEKYSRFGSFTTHPSTDAGDSGRRLEHVAKGGGCGSQSCPAAIQGEGLLHDARNLLGAVGLYCDLLAMPGVLKPEHSQYPEELRHLGARSGALIDTLMRLLLAREGSKELCPVARAKAAETDSAAQQEAEECEPSPEAAQLTKPVSLRGIVERCSGLLHRVANGRTLEVEFGPAAATPVRVPEEAVERILVNLVRNATAAMEHCGPRNSSACAIRVTLGMLASRVGESRPWPFQRVSLSVEDCGCGMSPSQAELLLRGGRASSGNSHGIGFRVVRELVAASGGDLQVLSAVESGTRVQIEWPVAAVSAVELEKAGAMERARLLLPLPLCAAPSRRLGDNIPRAQMEGAC